MPLLFGEARERALVAMLRFLNGPVLFDRTALPCCAWAPAMRLLVATGDQSRPLDQARQRSIALHERVNLIAFVVSRDRPLHEILFDVYVHLAGRVEHFRACRMWVPEGAGEPLFLSDVRSWPTIRLTRSGLRCLDMSRLHPIVRLAGIGRAQAQLAQVIWGGAAHLAGRSAFEGGEA